MNTQTKENTFPIQLRRKLIYEFLLKNSNKDNEKGIDPYFLTPGSGKKANWICKKCGYIWETSIVHRTTRESGCPFCAGKAVVTGKNDLATLKPELMKEWDYVENNKIRLDPTKLPIRTAKKAFWTCSVCGHKWSAQIASRSAGSGCPKYREHSKIGT